jgi:hypothetical protein
LLLDESFVLFRLNTCFLTYSSRVGLRTSPSSIGSASSSLASPSDSLLFSSSKMVEILLFFCVLIFFFGFQVGLIS